MPPRSDKQRKAMYAAASGKSTIGIPKAVGREFVGAPRTSAGGVPTRNPQQQAPQQSPQLQLAMMEAMRRKK